MDKSFRLLIVYWGRRGAFTPMLRALWEAGASRDDLDLSFSLSTAFEAFQEFATVGAPVHGIDTGGSAPNMARRLMALPTMRADLDAFLERERIQAAVILIPHLWTGLFRSVFEHRGVRTLAIVHDATPHPGDRTALLTPYLVAQALKCDRVATLSAAVREALVHRHPQAAGRVVTLFNPAFGYAPPVGESFEEADAPQTPALLFLGRILAYKGLGLLAEATEIACEAGAQFGLRVMGEGRLDRPVRERLAAIGASVCNRWFSEMDAAAALAASDAVLLPYTSASQSGAGSLALAAGRPILCTPVGGLAEQIEHEVSGLVAANTTPRAFADLLIRVSTEKGLLGRLKAGARARAGVLSMPAFLEALAAHMR